ncbi:hypothetical protein JOC61_000606 [Marinitoga litoralis]|nr:hypothetical protein [Marinitoga litoralis]
MGNYKLASSLINYNIDINNILIYNPKIGDALVCKKMN